MEVKRVRGEDIYDLGYAVVDLLGENVQWLKRFRLVPDDPDIPGAYWELVVGTDVFLKGKARRGEWVDCFESFGGLPVCAIQLFVVEIRLQLPEFRDFLNVEVEDSKAPPPPPDRLLMETPTGETISVFRGVAAIHTSDNSRRPRLRKPDPPPRYEQQCSQCGSKEFCQRCDRCETCGLYLVGVRFLFCSQY